MVHKFLDLLYRPFTASLLFLNIIEAQLPTQEELLYIQRCLAADRLVDLTSASHGSSPPELPPCIKECPSGSVEFEHQCVAAEQSLSQPLRLGFALFHRCSPVSECAWIEDQGVTQQGVALRLRQLFQVPTKELLGASLFWTSDDASGPVLVNAFLVRRGEPGFPDRRLDDSQADGGAIFLYMILRVDTKRLAKDDSAIQLLLHHDANTLTRFLGITVEVFNVSVVLDSPGPHSEDYNVAYRFKGMPWNTEPLVERGGHSCNNDCYLHNETRNVAGPHRCRTDVHCDCAGIRRCSLDNQCVGAAGHCNALQDFVCREVASSSVLHAQPSSNRRILGTVDLSGCASQCHMRSECHGFVWNVVTSTCGHFELSAEDAASSYGAYPWGDDGLWVCVSQKSLGSQQEVVATTSTSTQLTVPSDSQSSKTTRRPDTTARIVTARPIAFKEVSESQDGEEPSSSTDSVFIACSVLGCLVLIGLVWSQWNRAKRKSKNAPSSNASSSGDSKISIPEAAERLPKSPDAAERLPKNSNVAERLPKAVGKEPKTLGKERADIEFGGRKPQGNGDFSDDDFEIDLDDSDEDDLKGRSRIPGNEVTGSGGGLGTSVPIGAFGGGGIRINTKEKLKTGKRNIFQRGADADALDEQEQSRNSDPARKSSKEKQSDPKSSKDENKHPNINIDSTNSDPRGKSSREKRSYHESSKDENKQQNIDSSDSTKASSNDKRSAPESHKDGCEDSGSKYNIFTGAYSNGFKGQRSPPEFHKAPEFHKDACEDFEAYFERKVQGSGRTSQKARMRAEFADKMKQASEDMNASSSSTEQSKNRSASKDKQGPGNSAEPTQAKRDKASRDAYDIGSANGIGSSATRNAGGGTEKIFGRWDAREVHGDKDKTSAAGNAGIPEGLNGRWGAREVHQDKDKTNSAAGGAAFPGATARASSDTRPPASPEGLNGRWGVREERKPIPRRSPVSSPDSSPMNKPEPSPCPSPSSSPRPPEFFPYSNRPEPSARSAPSASPGRPDSSPSSAYSSRPDSSPTSAYSSKPEFTPCPSPRISGQDFTDVKAIEDELKRMVNAKVPLAERRRFFQQQCLRWHPDKNPDDVEHATKLFQSLQEKKAWFLKA